MSKGKKYSTHIEQVDSLWHAQITRQVTSRKVVVTKKKSDFESEAKAKKWADKALLELTKTLADSNTRHGEQRKATEEIQTLRSSRRADKTQQAKDEKARELEVDLGETLTEETNQINIDNIED